MSLSVPASNGKCDHHDSTKEANYGIRDLGRQEAHSETIHQSKKRVSKEQSRPGPKEFQFPIMLLVVTASGQAIRRLG